MLGSILQSVLLGRGEEIDTAPILDSALQVEDEECLLSSFCCRRAAGSVSSWSALGL
jgi:chemotaxis protein CheC